MRCGMKGHVVEPRGPLRAPAWRGGDTCVCLFIFTHNIGYSTFKHSLVGFKLTLKSVAPYKPVDFL